MVSDTFAKLSERAALCAEKLKQAKKVHLVSHIDADGISSAAIMNLSFERAGIPYTAEFVKKLDERVMVRLLEENHEMLVFTDLGSAMVDFIVDNRMSAVIADHHQPNGRPENIAADSATFPYHINPHLFGANGGFEISGSGVSYILACEIGGKETDNTDLAGLAIVGAIGDMQNRKYGKLAGLNREILEQGAQAGVIKYAPDLSLFGKQTRPIFKILQFSSEPYLPGLTGDEEACIRFLQTAGAGYDQRDGAKLWIELSMDEKRIIISALMKFCDERGFSSRRTQELIRECYTLLNEKEGTEMRDASEFSTLLNATGRYDKAETGVRVCMGDRDDALSAARTLLSEHRKNLVNGLNFVRENGVTQLKNIQYFYSGEEIKETIVGIIAGMASSLENVDRKKPIIGMADSEDGIKISSRGTQDLIRRGMNLSKAMNDVTEAVGGAGGGHDIAAGGTIPPEKADEFIVLLDEYIGRQLNQ
ncbi:MAG: DHH family phosphoesterase [Methanimicrococcus sp.]|nr:DHH family phosphoesterase [Methanimicrococcus sp.]